jgi:hypothetical protein
MTTKKASKIVAKLLAEANDHQLVDEHGVARLTELSVSKMRLAGTGPPFIKFNRSVRYSLKDLHEWLASLERRTK